MYAVALLMMSVMHWKVAWLPLPTEQEVTVGVVGVTAAAATKPMVTRRKAGTNEKIRIVNDK